MIQSEVAQLRQRIENEIAAMHFLMNGPSIVGRHDIVAHKYHNLSTYREQLADLVGEEQVGPLFFEMYTQAVEGNPDATPEK